MKANHKRTIAIITLSLIPMSLFQNCSKVSVADLASEEKVTVGIDPVDTSGNPVTPPVTTPDDPVMPCQGVSCDLDPLTDKVAVSTILLTLGDQSHSSLVINGASSQLIAETIIRSTTPVKNPKIAVVLDSVNANEDLEDIDYILDQLLVRYSVSVIKAPVTGITADDIKNFDLVWYNNPGHPMSSKKTLATLLAFKGGVVLQGDDLARGSENGKEFDMSPLTGLKYIDNGTSVVCGGKSYAHDNNAANQYRVSIDPTKILGENSAPLNFRYGNDIDNTVLAAKNVEVIATALGGPKECKEARPAIVRYFKK